MDYIQRLDRLILRAERLTKENGRQEADLLKAREDNQKLKLELDNQAQTLEDLNNRIKIIKLARSIEGGTDTTDLKRKINEYIREIDKSIAILNN